MTGAPLRRLGQPEEIAQTIVFLGSNEASGGPVYSVFEILSIRCMLDCAHDAGGDSMPVADDAGASPLRATKRQLLDVTSSLAPSIKPVTCKFWNCEVAMQMASMGVECLILPVRDIERGGQLW